MSTSKTGPTSTGESKTNSELLEEIRVLKEENQLLQSVQRLIRSQSDSVPNAERLQKWRQVCPDIVLMLSNPGFKVAYMAVVDDVQRQIFNTQPHESEVRERLYFQAQAVQALALKLAYMVDTVQKDKPKT